MSDFVAKMTNTWQFSNCDRPYQSITASRTQELIVELRHDTLTMTAIVSDVKQIRRMYAMRTLDLDGPTTFMILAVLPSRVVDPAFFPANGTVVLFGPRPPAPRRLRAVGTDMNSGLCHGWIFDAVEQ